MTPVLNAQITLSLAAFQGYSRLIEAQLRFGTAMSRMIFELGADNAGKPPESKPRRKTPARQVTDRKLPTKPAGDVVKPKVAATTAPNSTQRKRPRQPSKPPAMPETQ